MPFYVPVGPRGVVFRFGTLLITILGSLSYWRATRRRVFGAEVLAIPIELNEG